MQAEQRSAEDISKQHRDDKLESLKRAAEARKKEEEEEKNAKEDLAKQQAALNTVVDILGKLATAELGGHEVCATVSAFAGVDSFRSCLLVSW